jgi:glutamate dehydrogenase (NAD(P)+)
MRAALNTSPELVIEYTDPVEGFKGWLVIDALAHNLCAGGLRVQKGLTREIVERLAATMPLKMRIAGIRADGAKCGIDYDPASPGKTEALYRFLRAIRPYVLERYSIGPDMNTTMPELDTICARLDIPSIKTAVARAQGLSPDEFRQRIRLLSQPAGPESLGRLRAGAGLAAAAMAALEFRQVPVAGATAVIQGFGCLAASAAYFLNRAGVRIIALADSDKSLIGSPENPLDLASLLGNCTSGLIPDTAPTGRYGEREDIYDVACDIFIPAAVERTVDVARARVMEVGAIACGANLAVTAAAEEILHERGILVIPDMIAGCGGSVSMEGLFGPVECPTVQEVLDHVDRRIRGIVQTTLQRSRQDSLMPREAALRICAEAPLYPGTRPYGSPETTPNPQH